MYCIFINEDCLMGFKVYFFVKFIFQLARLKIRIRVNTVESNILGKYVSKSVHSH